MGRTRAYRRAERARVIANRLREVKNNNSLAKRNKACFWKPIGLLAKRKPFDCGKSACMVCHSEKVMGRVRHRYSFDWKNELEF